MDISIIKLKYFKISIIIKNGRNVVKIKKVGNYVKQFFAGTGS
jgi:hypothetical protein